MNAAPPARFGVPDRSTHEQIRASSLSGCHTASSQTMSAETTLAPGAPYATWPASRGSFLFARLAQRIPKPSPQIAALSRGEPGSVDPIPKAVCLVLSELAPLALADGGL